MRMEAGGNEGAQATGGSDSKGGQYFAKDTVGNQIANAVH